MQKIDPMEFRISASQVFNILGQKGLGETGKTYCENWLKQRLYGKKKSFYSKQTDKGTTVEADSIEYLAEQKGWGLVVKNNIRMTNSHMEGTPDLVLSEIIPDIKNSWDCFTFPLYEDIPDKKYVQQLNVYMELFKKDKAELIYVLMDAPDHLIDKEALFESRNRGEEEISMELYDEVKEKMTYSHLPASLRIKTFTLEKDQKLIDLIYSRVDECRTYIKSLQP